MSGRGETTRAAIWNAASRLFAADGYAATSVRDIASAAKVDPALVVRHFGSKEKLFLDSMTLEFEHRPLFDGPIETLGERYIEFVLEVDVDLRGVFLALIRASDGIEIGSRLRSAHEDNFVEPLRQRLEGPDRELRARLAAALVGGLLYSLWVVGDEALATSAHRDIVRHYGALLQQLITPERQ